MDDFRNAIDRCIKREIRIAIDNDCPRAAIILTYAAIDAMSFLGMPPTQKDVTKSDFVAWVEHFVRFPCINQLTGLDLYSARCAMLHTLTIQSKLTREGKARHLLYGEFPPPLPDVQFHPTMPFANVSISGLARAVFNGIDQFLSELASDPQRMATARERLSQMLIDETRFTRIDG